MMKLFLAFLLLSLTSCTDPESLLGIQQTEPGQYATSQTVTVSQYDQINIGMDYSSVVNILGSPTSYTESTFGGDTAITYIWVNKDTSGVSLQVKEGKVTLKTQTGLK